jgi:hypothetical protein
MAYLDYKATVWFRIKLNDDTNVDEVVKQLERYEPHEAVAMAQDEYITECDLMYETETYLDPSDNNDFSTVEIYSDKGELIYQNGKEI